MIHADGRIEQLARVLHAARARDDVEAIHDLRVVTRRLDAWLRLGGRRVLRDDLAWLRRTCGRLRNLDVLLANGGLPAPFHSWLERGRGAVRGGVEVTLADPRADATVEALARMPAVPVEFASVGLARVLRSVERRGRAVDANPDDLEALHALRRSLRTLRFAAEWVGEDAPLLVRLQDAFGDLNDTAGLVRGLNDFLDADPAFVRQTNDHLEQARKSAVRAWRKAEPDLLDLVAKWTSS